MGFNEQTATIIVIIAIIIVVIFIKIRNVIAKRKAKRARIIELETNRFLRRHLTCPDDHEWNENRIEVWFDYENRFHEIRAWCKKGQCFGEDRKCNLIRLIGITEE